MNLLSIVFGAVFTAVVSWGLGRLLFRKLGIGLKHIEHDLLAGVTGASLLSLAVFLLCTVKLARAPVFLAFGPLLLLTRKRESVGSLLPVSRFWKYLFGIAFAFYAVVYLSNSLAPEISPDGSTYHLGLVARYFRDHGFERITTSLYANLSQGMEMLFLFAFAFGRHSAAATVHCLFLLTLPFLMLSYGRRLGHPAAGVCAAMLVYLAPLAGIDGVSAYNDVALATVAFAMFYLLEIWREAPDWRLLIPIGLLAGFCFAIKYTGFVAMVYALITVIATGRTRKWLNLATLSGAAALIALPWLIKNQIWLGNPFSPFFNRLFPNPYIHPSFEDVYTAELQTYLLPSLKPIFWMVTVSGRLGGQVGPLFLLAPIALVGLRNRTGRACLLATLLFLVPYPRNIGARFLIPVLPFAAFGITLALDSSKKISRVALAALVVTAAILAWPRVIDRYRVAAGGWQIVHVPWKAALQIVSPEKYLETYSRDYNLVRRINAVIPPGKRVWSTMPLAEAYTQPTVLVNYYSAEGETIEDILQTAIVEGYQPLWKFRFTFPRQKLSHLRIAQTANYAGDVWSIAEARFYRGDEEVIPAHAEAQPFRWDARYAFDHNPVTRWRSWESLYAGMRLDVDFGAPAALDRVELDCSHDEWHMAMHLEGEGLGNVKVEQFHLPPNLDLRRLATRTIKSRGIDYLLIGGDYMAAADIRNDPQRWGLRIVLDRDTDRIYEIQ